MCKIISQVCIGRFNSKIKNFDQLNPVTRQNVDS
jgi:hypothetical protein